MVVGDIKYATKNIKINGKTDSKGYLHGIVKFVEYDIGQDSSKMEEMLKKSNGARTVPQIFIGDQHIRGSTELQKLDKEGKLDSLVRA